MTSKDAHTLDALAPFKVLSVMCHPGRNARLSRESMIARIQSETGEGQPRRRPLNKEEFSQAVRLNSGQSVVAGASANDPASTAAQRIQAIL